MNNTTKIDGIAAELLKAAGPDYPDNPQDILCPSWLDVGKVHDWRNYVPDGMRDRWLSLSPDARVAVYIMAEGFASSEDWD